MTGRARIPRQRADSTGTAVAGRAFQALGPRASPLVAGPGAGHLFGELAAPAGFRSPAGHPVLQRREVGKLVPGRLNMLGETHTDYPTIDARRYEARVVRSEMGESTEYLTEQMLKVSDSDPDYADPTGLRLEQVIAFIEGRAGILIPKLAAIDPEEVKAELNRRGSAIKVAARLAPRVASDGYDREILLVEIRKMNLPPETLELLSGVDVWDFETHDPQDKYEGNLDDLTDALLRLSFEMKQQQQLSLGTAPLTRLKQLANEIRELFTDFAGRLPTTLKQYLYLRETKPSYAGFEFKFSEIPKAYIRKNVATTEIGMAMPTIRVVFQLL